MKTVSRIKAFASEWILPPAVLRLGRSWKKEVLNGNARSRRYLGHSNQVFKNAHRGERCFVLATGPSIKSQDLSSLKNEVCIGCSFFFLHEQARLIQPKYHMLAPNHPPYDFDLPAKYLEGLQSRYDHECTVFYGHYPFSYSVLEYLTLNRAKTWKEGISIKLIDYSERHTLSESNFQDHAIWDISRSPFVMRTVIYGAIQLAAFMGCNEIILLGCDHDYLSELRRNRHFYDDAEVNEKSLQETANRTYEILFYDYYARWRDFRLMRQYLFSQGIEIVNATAGGMLDVFPRKSLESLFEKSGVSGGKTDPVNSANAGNRERNATECAPKDQTAQSGRERTR